MSDSYTSKPNGSLLYVVVFKADCAMERISSRSPERLWGVHGASWPTSRLTEIVFCGEPPKSGHRLLGCGPLQRKHLPVVSNREDLDRR